MGLVHGMGQAQPAVAEGVTASAPAPVATEAAKPASGPATETAASEDDISCGPSE